MALSIEQHVRVLYTAAGYDSSSPPGPAALIGKLLGTTALSWSTEGRSALLHFEDGWRIRVSVTLAGSDLCIELGRALARWYLFTRLPEETPPALDDLTSELLMPRDALALAIESAGRDAGAVAEMFVVTKAMAVRAIRRLVATPRSGQYPRVVA